MDNTALLQIPASALRQIDIDPPLVCEPGDFLMAAADGTQVGRYGSDGHLIETRRLTRPVQ